MRRLILTLVAALLFASVPTATVAQEARGTIQGRVSDASGGTIPGATIEVTSRATGVVTTATSNAEGNYRVPFLTPGVYRVTIGSITLDQALTYQLYAGQVSHTLLSLAGRMPATDPEEGCRWLEAQMFAELSPYVGDAPGTHVKATPVQLPDGRVAADIQINPTFKIQEKPLEFQVQLPLR